MVEAALSEILSRQPDVVILDVDMPHKTGLEVLRNLGENAFAGKAILLTVHNEEEFFDEAIENGAKGYLLKDSVVEDIIVAIRTIVSGQNFVSPALTTMLFSQKRRRLKPNRRNSKLLLRPNGRFSSSSPNTEPTIKSLKRFSSARQRLKLIAATSARSSNSRQSFADEICRRVSIKTLSSDQ
jgi:DNA-binding NarL/FixJ family response regulator